MADARLNAKLPTRSIFHRFRVTSAGVGVWRWIENGADPIQDCGGRMQTTRAGDNYDASGGLF